MFTLRRSGYWVFRMSTQVLTGVVSGISEDLLHVIQMHIYCSTSVVFEYIHRSVVCTHLHAFICIHKVNQWAWPKRPGLIRSNGSYQCHKLGINFFATCDEEGFRIGRIKTIAYLGRHKQQRSRYFNSLTFESHF